jgi:hypothetical protein
MMGTLLVIGWNEYVDLPDWGVRRLRAKVDTGARTSALHVDRIDELPGGRVRFDVVLHRKKRDRRIRVEARIRRRGRVRSSTGHYTTRIFVKTRVRIGPTEHEIEVSLVDREKMLHRMLLGREALEGRYLVDVSRRAVLAPKRRRVRKTKKTRRVRGDSSVLRAELLPIRPELGSELSHLFRHRAGAIEARDMEERIPLVYEGKLRHSDHHA